MLSLCSGQGAILYRTGHRPNYLRPVAYKRHSEQWRRQPKKSWGGQKLRGSGAFRNCLLNHASQTLEKRGKRPFLAFLIYFERLEKQLSQAACLHFLHDQMFQVNENQPPPNFFQRISRNTKSTSGKTGVDISTPIHPVTTPLTRRPLGI